MRDRCVWAARAYRPSFVVGDLGRDAPWDAALHALQGIVTTCQNVKYNPLNCKR